jgi:hypothetical protein
MESDGRKHPVHAPVYERHNTPVIVFLTVCTKDRRAILANDAAHKLLLTAWQTQPSWLVGRYVILPDHLHLFCAPAKLIGTTHIRRCSVQAPVVPPRMGGLLEIILGASLAASWRRTDLATSLLGYPAAPG